jgi:hypothetical protein
MILRVTEILAPCDIEDAERPTVFEHYDSRHTVSASKDLDNSHRSGARLWSVHWRLTVELSAAGAA